MVSIDKGVPRPDAQRRLSLPFEEMEVGDSFLVDQPGIGANHVYTRAYNYGIKFDPPKKFSIRSTDEGVRCWRIK